MGTHQPSALCLRYWAALFLVSVFSLPLRSQDHPLAIPPLLQGNEFELNVQTGQMELVPGFQTPTYGVNGPLLGPTLMVHKGDSVTIHVTNHLGTSTTMHWHGLHVPARFDGGPHQVITNGTTWSPSFRILNDAATYWYHPHGEGKTELQVAKGIAGVIIVHDSIEESLALPSSYGVDDIPLVIQTKAFDELHQLSIATEMDTLLMVNGTTHASWNAPAQVVRLRLLNGCSMRSMYIGFSNSMHFSQIATDGGLLAKALDMTRIRISPGERVEIVVNLSGMKGQSLSLRNYGGELPTGIYGSSSVGMGMSTIPDYSKNPLNGSSFDVLKLNVTEPTASAILNMPSTLRAIATISPSQATVNRTLEFAPESMSMNTMVIGPFLINGKHFNMDVINEHVNKDAVEIWTLKNSTMIAHPFHIHDVQFQILDVNGGAVPGFYQGMKDVALVLPQQTLRFITKFSDFADNNVPYMYHCHMLHHEDDGMMGSFIVNESGNDVAVSIAETISSYPQPSTGLVNLALHCAHDNEMLSVNVRDLCGRSCASLSAESHNNMLRLDLSDLENGLYHIELRSPTHIHNCCICIQH